MVFTAFSMAYPLPPSKLLKVSDQKGLGPDLNGKTDALDRLQIEVCGKKEPRLDAGAVWCSVSIITGGGKLLCHAIVLDWRGLGGFWGLTGFQGRKD
jgi:hypothetical protein